MSDVSIRSLVSTRILTRIDGKGWAESDDLLPVEAPLTISLAGEAWMTTMRTPGDDHALAMGLLFAEGLVAGVADVSKVSHCGDPSDERYGHLLEVSPGPGVAFDPERFRRGTLSSASCGVCGREQIDDLLARIPRAPRDGRSSVHRIERALEDLASGQEAFRRTGAIHGAAAFNAGGERLCVAEDVGRHNAIDKVVGRLLLEDLLDQAIILAVSGRASFEVLQKAAVAGFPIVAAAKGPTTMSVDVAQAAGITLCGFVRAGRMNVYSHLQRLGDP